MKKVIAMTDSPAIEIDPQTMSLLADSQMNLELDNGDMILNMGPQHPATHGTLRLVVRLTRLLDTCIAGTKN